MSNIFERTHLASSLLLTGASLDEALTLAKQILGFEHAAKIDSGNHPDVHRYAPEGKSQLHTVASMHKLIQEMALPPFEAKAKVFILEEAEKMLPSASNALLKTLEEPNEDTFFLVVTNRPDLLLTTIRSRLYPISFSQKELKLPDLTGYASLARQDKWDEFFEALPALEEEEAEAVFQAFLELVGKEKNPKLFLKSLALVEQGHKALAHNVKPLHVYAALFLNHSL